MSKTREGQGQERVKERKQREERRDKERRGKLRKGRKKEKGRLYCGIFWNAQSEHSLLWSLENPLF